MHTSTPTVTVIIPMRNEERRIARCLASILANDFPHDKLEILVADGMSEDRSAQVIARYSADFPIVRRIENHKRIVPAGLNLGIAQARGDLVIIMGAHCQYPHDYISTCVRELERTHADVVGGVLNTLPGSNTLIARSIALMTSHPFGVGSSSFRTRSGCRFVDTVPYGAYRREVFERVGVFDEALARNQDFELNARVRRAGGKLFLSEDLTVDYYNVPNFRRLLSQAFNNGLWLAKMWLHSCSSFRLRHAIPLVFVSVLLACFGFGLANGVALLIGESIFALYSVAAMFSASQISHRQGVRFFFPVLALFFAHHFAYGLGTLAGFLNSVRSGSNSERTTSPTHGPSPAHLNG